MAQTLKSKVKKLSEAYSITAIIETAKEVQIEQADCAVWNAMSTEEKTKWFLAQCKKYNLTPDVTEQSIYIDELASAGERAYFIVFLPRNGQGWHMEIGGSYDRKVNGGTWSTSPGLKGKERQIAEVMKLHKAGM
jgi:hypothetical protein